MMTAQLIGQVAVALSSAAVLVEMVSRVPVSKVTSRALTVMPSPPATVVC